MTRAQILRQQREARRTMKQLARLYPGAFDKQGKPRVAVLRWPPEVPGGV